MPESEAAHAHDASGWLRDRRAADARDARGWLRDCHKAGLMMLRILGYGFGIG